MDDLIYTGNRTMYIILLLSAVPIGVATVVGLVVGLLQTVTQLQEQTLPFGIKLVAVFVSLVVLLGWLSSRMLEFADYAMKQALSG
jgi:type III secretion system export apparatus protein